MSQVNVQVEARGLLALLDDAFRRFMRSAPALMIAFALSSFPTLLVLWLAPNPSFMWGATALVFVLDTIVSIAVVRMVHDEVRGYRVSFSEALRAVRPRMFPAVVSQVLVLLLVASASVPVMLAIEAPLLMLLALPVFFVVAIASMLFFSLVLPVVTVESLTLGALKRSASLVRGHMLRVFALLAVFWVLGLVVAIATGFSEAVGAPEGESDWTSLFLPGGDVSTLGQAVVQVITSALFKPISVIAFTLLYVDIRIRKEGYDVELLAEAGEPAEELS